MKYIVKYIKDPVRDRRGEPPYRALIDGEECGEWKRTAIQASTEHDRIVAEKAATKIKEA